MNKLYTIAFSSNNRFEVVKSPHPARKLIRAQEHPNTNQAGDDGGGSPTSFVVSQNNKSKIETTTDQIFRNKKMTSTTSSKASSTTMNVIAIQENKSVSIVQVTKPSIEDKPDSILVQVAYAALDTALEEIVHKTFTGIMVHDRKAKPLVPGYHFSGTIEAVGSNVAKNEFQVGDTVFGHLQYSPSTKQGSCSEYVVVP